MKALYNAVILKPIENQEISFGSIVVPNIENEVNKKGEVISVGPGSYSITGELIPTQLKEGDIVVLPTMGFTKFIHNQEEYWIGKENECLCIIN